jgi:hypothetical protein
MKNMLYDKGRKKKDPSLSKTTEWSLINVSLGVLKLRLLRKSICSEHAGL